MRRLWEWIKGEYKLWKLRREDPYIYEADEYDEADDLSKYLGDG